MKRSASLILAGGLTALIGITIFVLGFSAVITPIQAGADNLMGVDVAIPTQIQLPQVDVEATAQAIQYQNRQTESQTLMQEREAALQAQIEHSQQAIGELDSVSQAQLAKMRAELVELKAQIDQVTASNQATQAHVEQLQQTIQNDDAVYQNQLATLQANLSQAENQIKQETETVYAQLQAAYDQIAQRQAAAAQAAAAQAAASSGSGGGGSHDDDDDDHEDNDRDGDDHEDDDHEEGDDDD
jgi:transcriptional regulator of acetoin/glycerol metabolism